MAGEKFIESLLAVLFGVSFYTSRDRGRAGVALTAVLGEGCPGRGGRTDKANEHQQSHSYCEPSLSRACLQDPNPSPIGRRGLDVDQMANSFDLLK